MSAALMDTHTLTAVIVFDCYFIPVPQSSFPNFFPIIMLPLERKHCNTFTEILHPLVIICHPARGISASECVHLTDIDTEHHLILSSTCGDREDPEYESLRSHWFAFSPTKQN